MPKPTKHLVIDIETVRDESVLWETKPREFVSGPPFQHVTGQIQASWPILPMQDPFPPPPCHQVVCIGAMLLDEHRPVWSKCVGELDDNEPRQLFKFLGYVEKECPRIVSFNGRRFDVPVIALRAGAREPLAPLAYWMKVLEDYRYRQALHVDLADTLSGFGAAPMTGLGQYAALFGLGGKTEGMHGGGVAAALKEPNGLAKVREYCLQDVRLTAALFLETERMKGVLSMSRYEECKARLKDMASS